MRAIKLHELEQILYQHYPLELAESWDKVGLHFGDSNRPIKNILTALDIRPNLIQEAIEKNIDTIIVHHPPIFHPIKRFDLSDPVSQMYAQIIKNDINVIALHTNLDIAWNGMNDWLAQSLGLSDIRDFNGNRLQDYTHDSQAPSLGRVGITNEPLSKLELISQIKDKFNLKFLTTIEKNSKEMYNRVAIVGGAGGSLLDQVASLAVDAYITGDITYHIAQEAEDIPMLTVDAGHYIEHIFVDKMAEIIQSWAREYEWDIKVLPSTSVTSAMSIE